MALFINVDLIAPRWWVRKVHRGWQFGYSGGTQNDFMLDVEVACWRFACYVGLKKVQNYAPEYERHLKWQREQEHARERAHKPESAFKRFWRSLRRTQAAGHRVDPQQFIDDQTFTDAQQYLATERELRFGQSPFNGDDQRRCHLAAWASLPAGVLGNGTAPLEGELLHQEHQRPASDDHDQKESESLGLSKESKS